QVRTLIQRGRLAAAAPLPSARQLALQLGVSRTTVDAALAQLKAEGYLEARPRAGVIVAATLPDHVLAVGRPAERAAREEREAFARPPRPARRVATAWPDDPTATRDVAEPIRPFMTGTPLVDARLRDEFARRSAALWRGAPRELLHYGDPAGYRPLREAIAAHVAYARAVRATAAQVIVTNGAQQALGLAAQLALDPGDTAWIEDPGYLGARSTLRTAGARLVPMRVDEQGLDVEHAARRAPRARLAYVTPSHQYPLGHTMSATRRYALLAWARRAGAWILEDDYDSEYRYTSAPLPSLQGLDDDGRVLYVGTFSKTLVPALRLGYLIVPPALAEAARRARAVSDRNAPTVEQALVAGMLADGSYARHVRRMRLLYAERQAALVAALRAHAAPWLEVAPAEAGLHLVGWLPRGTSDAAVAHAARHVGLEVAPLSRLALGRAYRPGLMLGYAAFTPARLARAAEQLGMVLRELLGKGDA
ncbi:MAG: PLP-dependent aminotransferase family protein, partial [Gemmatimonadetes bacterium]|nr:PLP-dependent aminotransferase family protein [Gemmatimonadota bacterium]